MGLATDGAGTLERVPRVRSALYIPGHRKDYLAKADQRGADAVIIDLEDAVAESARGAALATASEWIAARTDPLHPVVFVRINALEAGRLTEDLDAVVHRNLTAVVVPKLHSEHGVGRVADALSYEEGKKGVPHGHVRLWPLLETAGALQRSVEIARSSSRIAYMGGAAADGGDLARALGFRWTPGAEETAYLRARVLIDVRAAGVPNPMTGMVSTIDQPGEVESFARRSWDLGYEGMMVIHPAHVPIANAAFTPSEEEVEEARAIVATLEEAATRGSAALVFQGRLIDTAMIETATRLLDDHARLQRVDGGS